MKIAIVVNYKPSNECGVSVVAQDIAKELSKKHEVLYICLGNKYKEKVVNKHLTYLAVPSVSIKQLDVPQLTPDVVKLLFNKLESFNPKVIHLQNLLFMDLACMVWALKNNLPLVVTFHAIISEGPINYVFPKIKGVKIPKLTRKPPSTNLTKHILNKVDLVIALNKYVKKSVLKVNPKARIKTINNPLDIKSYKKLKIRKPTKTKKFIFLGSYISRKNQEYLLQVFKNLPSNFQLNLYGNKTTGADYVKRLEKIIRKNSIKNVILNDYINRSKVGEVLEKSDYFVSASLKEAQSLVIIESLASGTPVIGLENETINELVNPSNGLKLTQEASPKEFATQLLSYVARDENVYKTTANNCRKSVETFDIEDVSKRIVKTYKEIIIAKDKTSRNPSKLSVFIETAIPYQLKELIEPVFPHLNKRKRQKSWFVKVFFGIAVVCSLIVAGLVKLITLGRKK